MRFRSWANQFQSYMDQHPAIARSLSLAWVASLCFLAFLWNLGSVGLVDETEPLFSEAARQMTVTGDWITPMFNDATRFDKPPLIYWLVAIAYKTIGVNEWAARLPSALAAIALVSGCFWILLRFSPLKTSAPPESHETDGSGFNWIAAWVGSALVALHPLTLIWARAGVSDMLLSACVGLSLLAFFAGYAQPEKPQTQTRWYYCFYIMVALAILTKGPIGAVIPALTIGLFSLYLGNWQKLWREIRLLPGTLLTLAISVPWFVLVIARNGEAYIDSFFGYHNLERFVSVVNRHSAPWYFYFIIVFLGFMPWSTYLPAAIAHLQLTQRSYWQKEPRSHQLGLFAFSWFIAIFGFFTISVTKLPSYVLPLMPAAAILVALFWSDRLQSGTLNRTLRWTTIVQIAVLALYTVTCWFLPHLLGPDPSAPLFNRDLEQAGFFWGSALIWGMATLLEAFFLIRRDVLGLWLVNAIAFLIFLGGILQPLTFMIDSHRQLPLRQIAQVIPEQRHPDEPLLMFGFKKPSLVFYTHQTFDFYWDGNEYLDKWKQDPKRLPAVAVVSADSLKDLKLQDYSVNYQLLDDRGNYQLIRLLPAIPKPNHFLGKPSSQRNS